MFSISSTFYRYFSQSYGPAYCAINIWFPSNFLILTISLNSKTRFVTCRPVKNTLKGREVNSSASATWEGTLMSCWLHKIWHTHVKSSSVYHISKNIPLYFVTGGFDNQRVETIRNAKYRGWVREFNDNLESNTGYFKIFSPLHSSPSAFS